MQPAKPTSTKCNHDHLHFEQGGLYLVCDNCKYTWAAVGTHPMRIVQDVMARAMGLTEMDKRSNPMAVKPIVKKQPKEAPKRPSQVLIEAVWKSMPPPAPRPGFVQVKPKSQQKLKPKGSKKSS